jgi:hypothetical protein
MNLLRRIAPSYENTRTFLVAVAVISILAIAWGAYTYVSAARTLATLPNLASAMEGLAPDQAKAVASAYQSVFIQQRQLVLNETRALMVGGAGLIGLGVAWLVYDIVNRRRNAPKSPPKPTPNDASKTAPNV